MVVILGRQQPELRHGYGDLVSRRIMAVVSRRIMAVVESDIMAVVAKAKAVAVTKVSIRVTA
jgi:hypothetical protein